MAPVNYEYLQRLVSSRLELYGLRISDRTEFYLNRIIRDVEGGNIALPQTSKDLSYMLASGLSSYDIPNLIANQPFSVKIREEGSNVEPYDLTKVTRGQVNEQTVGNYRGMPTHYAIEIFTFYNDADPPEVVNPNAVRLRLFPETDRGYELFVSGHFFSVLPDWENTDTNWLILNEPDLLKYGICSYIAGDQGAEERSQMEWELYRVELRGDLESHGKDGLLTRMMKSAAPEKGYGFEVYERQRRAEPQMGPEVGGIQHDPGTDPRLVIQQIPISIMTRAQANAYINTVPNERRIGTTYIGQEDNKLYSWRNLNGVTGWHPLASEGEGVAPAPTLFRLVTYLANNAGVRDPATNEAYLSITGDYQVRGQLTAAHPRFGFQLAEDRALVGIYENGFDVSADFVAGAGRTYVHNRDVGAGAVQYLIRTRSAA